MFFLQHFSAAVAFVSFTCTYFQTPTACGFFKRIPGVVAEFDSTIPETPEGVSADANGTVYVSLALTGEIRAVHADGNTQSLVQFPLGQFDPALPFPPFLGPLTARYDGTLFVSVSSNDLSARGVWRVNPDGTSERIVALPQDSVPNGIALRLGKLYIADSVRGVVWIVGVEGGVPEIWVQHESMQPFIAPGVAVPGANGIQILDDEVYVSSSAAAVIAAYPIEADGSAGPRRVVVEGLSADDFAIDSTGALWVTTNPTNMLIHVTPEGSQAVVLTLEDGLDNPTAATFGRGPRDRNILYISNAAFPFSSATYRPSILKLKVLVDGADAWPF